MGLNANDCFRRRQIGILIGAIGLGLVLIWLCLGRTNVEKLITDLVMPVGAGFVGILVGWGVSVRRRRREGVWFWGVAACLVFVAGNRPLAGWAIGRLEAPYRAIEPLNETSNNIAGALGYHGLDGVGRVENIDAEGSLTKSTTVIPKTVLLLGGATGETPAGEIQVNQNGDRIVLTARLYHRGTIETIYCSGAVAKSTTRFTTDEAGHAERLLTDLGVEPSAIRMIGGANTADELKLIASQQGDQPIGIITNAWHLGRAMRLADQADVNAVPIPCGFASGNGAAKPWGVITRELVPHHDALETFGIVIKELLASIVQR